MSAHLIIRGSFAAAVCFIAASMSTPAHPADGPQQYVRESHAVTVRGVREIWQLVWEEKPKSVCEPEDVSSSTTCPCSGFAYGEYGDLALVRLRNGVEVERMQLGPLFGSEYPADKLGKAILQRWPVLLDDLPRDDRGDPKLLADIKARRQPTIMRPADYDRDQFATEFLLQVATVPCGKHQYVAVGISAKEPHLHALRSIANPNEPLIMPRSAWEALLEHPGPTAVTTWPCGDHGSDQRSEMVVSARKGEIRVKQRLHLPGRRNTRKADRGKRYPSLMRRRASVEISPEALLP